MVINESWYYNKMLRLAPLSPKEKVYKTALDDGGITRYDLSDMISLGPAPDAWIVPNLIPHPGRVIGYGPPSACKTTTFFDLLVAIAGGEDEWLSFQIRKNGRVLIWSSEGDIWKNRTRLLRHIRVRNEIDPNKVDIRYCQDPVPIDLPEGWHRFESIIAAERPLICIIDPWVNFISGDENSTTVAKEGTKFLDHIIKEYETTLIILHHAGKDKERKLRGSSVLSGWSDSTIKFDERKVQDGDFTKLLPPSMMKGAKPIEISNEKLREGAWDKTLIAIPTFSKYDDGIITFSVMRDELILSGTKEEKAEEERRRKEERDELIIKHFMTIIFDVVAMTTEPLGWTDISIKCRFQAQYNALAKCALQRLVANKSVKLVTCAVRAKNGHTRNVEKYILDREGCKIDSLIDTIKEVHKLREKGLPSYGISNRNTSGSGTSRSAE